MVVSFPLSYLLSGYLLTTNVILAKISSNAFYSENANSNVAVFWLFTEIF